MDGHAALRDRADELAGHRRELAERARGIAGGLSRVRILAGAELADGLRRLREDSADRLADPDHPRHLAAAVAELGRRYLHRVAELHTALAARTLAGLDTGAPRFTADPWTPPPAAPPRRTRQREGLLLLGAVPVGCGLLRLVWADGPTSPLVAGLAVSVVLAAVCWIVGARRSGARRDRLERWSASVLAEARQALELEHHRRELDVEPQVRGRLVELSARLERQMAAYQRAVRAADRR